MTGYKLQNKQKSYIKLLGMVFTVPMLQKELLRNFSSNADDST